MAMKIKERLKEENVVVSPNIDISSREGKIEVLNMMQNKQKQLKSIVGNEICVTAYIVDRRQYEAKEANEQHQKGELIDSQKICLRDKNGEWYSISGEAVLNMMDCFIVNFGEITEENPMVADVKLTASDTNKDRSYVSLILK